MKKIILVFIALSFASVCVAGSIQDKHKSVIARQTVAGGGGCDTPDEECDGTGIGDFNIGQWTPIDYGASPFDSSGTGAVCKVALAIKKTGTPTYDIRACIYSTNTATTPDEPDALIGTCSDWVDQAAVTTSYTLIDFTGMDSGALTDSVQYFIVMESDDPGVNHGSDYYSWQKTSGCSAPSYFMVFNEGAGTWSEGHASLTGEWTIYH